MATAQSARPPGPAGWGGGQGGARGGGWRYDDRRGRGFRDGGVRGGQEARRRDGDGGDPRRQGGEDMRRQGGGDRETTQDFLTMFKRKNCVVIDLSRPEFFRRKPSMSEIGDWVGDHLCQEEDLMAAIQDVQLHPLRCNIYIKFSETGVRDRVADKLLRGVQWPDWNVTVYGGALDKPITVVRLKGVNPDTKEEEIRNTMEEYGKVVGVRRGVLCRRFPGISDGSWLVRMLLGEEGKPRLPSLIYCLEDGEIWQVLHDHQQRVCYKCGRGGHIGDRCAEQPLTLQELSVARDVPRLQGEENQLSWAGVVKGQERRDREEENRRHELAEQYKREAMEIAEREVREAQERVETEARERREADARDMEQVMVQLEEARLCEIQQVEEHMADDRNGHLEAHLMTQDDLQEFRCNVMDCGDRYLSQGELNKIGRASVGKECW